LVVAVIGVATLACTSTPPLPSAGTSTPTPALTPTSSEAPSTIVPELTTPPSPTPTASPTPTPSPTVPPTPPPTLPPSDVYKAELFDPSSLTSCVALVGAPAASLDNKNDVSGYNVAFADAIASRLGVKSVIRDAQFDELIAMLESHECDVAVSSQNITADRSSQINLVPYTQSKQGFPVVVATGNPLSIDSLEELCGRVVSAATGTTNVDVVTGSGDYAGRGLTQNCADQGLAAITLETYPTEIAALDALINGAVSAYLGNSNFATQAEYKNLIQTSAATLPGTHQGIGVALDHPNLTTAVEAALGAMIVDGSYVRVLSEYIASQSVDNFSIVE
jgi:polar amino acid transport system substrate-binding protein